MILKTIPASIRLSSKLSLFQSINWGMVYIQHPHHLIPLSVQMIDFLPYSGFAGAKRAPAETNIFCVVNSGLIWPFTNPLQLHSILQSYLGGYGGFELDARLNTNSFIQASFSIGWILHEQAPWNESYLTSTGHQQCYCCCTGVGKLQIELQKVSHANARDRQKWIDIKVKHYVGLKQQI